MRISAMMWDCITEPGGLLDAYGALQGKMDVEVVRAPGEGRLLDFRRPPPPED